MTSFGCLDGTVAALNTNLGWVIVLDEGALLVNLFVVVVIN